MIILGVDAAWSERNPSGLALLQWEPGEKPSIIAIARSYDEFLNYTLGRDIDWKMCVRGSKPDFRIILEKIYSLTSEKPRVIALDLPLSPYPIIGRRACDNKVSSLYGKMGAAVHSPSADNTAVSGMVYEQLTVAGYDLLLEANQRCFRSGAFMEVYPHIAIIKMLGLDYRLAYKVQKRSSYWKNYTSEERLENVFNSLELLRDGLNNNIEGVQDIIPPIREIVQKVGSSISLIKSYEDMIDAIVCAWMGYKYVIGTATGYGDDHGVIWGPMS